MRKCKIYTAQYQYPGPDRIDITYKTKDFYGLYFKPTPEMVHDYKNNKIDTDQYTYLYNQLMRQSYTQNKQWWKQLLHRKTITFVCYCKVGDFCHRLLLANYFSKIGGIYIGERKQIQKIVWE